MKPHADRLAIVTATVAPWIAEDCFLSWIDHGSCTWPVYIDWNGATTEEDSQARKLYDGQPFPFSDLSLVLHPTPIGVVPAYASACRRAAQQGAEILVCLHDDVRIDEDGWDLRILAWFDAHPQCLLTGFGGGKGLGSDDIYQVPYTPYQLARQDFVSNLEDAEQHGRRVTDPTPIACTDGFSIIGRAPWLAESLTYLERLGVKHHMYDGALGGLCRRAGGEAWLIPVACKHFGGRTAVESSAYHLWASQQAEGSDHGFWTRAHELCYHDLRDVLPLRS